MEDSMSTVTVSPKYQVVIPRQVREEFDIRPGEKVQVFVYEGRIELVPVRRLRRLRGIVRGIDTSVEREEDRA
jgi:AbrB family looped-hinge helix DNA binding protein